LWVMEKQVAGHSAVEDRPVGFAEGALIAWRLARQEDTSKAVDAFDGSVDPGTVYLPGGAVDPEACFAVVETGENEVRPEEETEAAVLHNVGREWVDFCVRQDVAIAGGNRFCLRAADI